MEILTQGEKSTSPKRRVSSFFNEKKNENDFSKGNRVRIYENFMNFR